MFFKKKLYSVKMKGRSTVIYTEGLKVMNLFFEMSADDGIMIHKHELERWERPFDQYPISDEEQSRIQTNISEELLKSKIPVTWD